MSDAFTHSFLHRCFKAGVEPVTATLMLRKEAAAKIPAEQIKRARIMKAIHVIPSLIQ